MLQEVRIHGKWGNWLEFFLKGIHSSAQSAIQTTQRINELFYLDVSKIQTLGRARFVAEQVLEYMKHLPQVTVPILAYALNITAPTARSALESMVKLEILNEISGKKRDKVYVYKKYLNYFEEGAVPYPLS